MIRAGESYALDRDMTERAALDYWFGADKETYLAEDDQTIVGSYFIRPNQAGGGSHACNCGYLTAARVAGRGVGRRMCLHSMERARERGYRAMQFNFVISANERAVKLWLSLGFEIVGRLPEAFQHPERGLVEALVMHRRL